MQNLTEPKISSSANCRINFEREAHCCMLYMKECTHYEMQLRTKVHVLYINSAVIADTVKDHDNT